MAVKGIIDRVLSSTPATRPVEEAWPSDVLPARLDAGALEAAGEALRDLVEDCRGVEHPFFIPIQRFMTDLERFSAKGSALENPGAHDLWSELKSKLERTIEERKSLPRAMFPLLMREDALQAFTSLSVALKGHLFDFLISAYPAYIDGPRSWLEVKPLEEMETLPELKEYIAEIMKYEEMFSTKLLSNPDPGFALSKLSIDLIRSGLRDNFRRLLDEFIVFQQILSNMLVMANWVDSGSDLKAVRGWQETFAENEDLFRDADNLLTSLDITFLLLHRYEEKGKLRDMLESLRSFEFSRLNSIIDMAINVNRVRAAARNTRIVMDFMPAMAVPKSVRVDLFRAPNELLLNAIAGSDLSREDRNIDIQVRPHGGVLRIRIADNGPGIEGLTERWAMGGPGGLGRIDRISKKHGWEFTLKTKPGEGTEAEIAIDIAGWGAMIEAEMDGSDFAASLSGPGGVVANQLAGAAVMLPSFSILAAI